jgi:radical SAM superfamily enzyme YgiQ (UPF0313 family)
VGYARAIAMRIALVYPPPWKIAAPGEPPFGRGEGPPASYRAGDLDADFHQTPYGLFALGAAALRAGHEVKVLNLSAVPWRRVEEVLAALDADVYGLSCWTANRRGVAYAAASIKASRPRARVVVGGPHATPLADEILRRTPAIDAIALGEADETFLEMIERAAAGRSFDGLAGAVVRDARGRPVRGPHREPVAKLDALATPHAVYPTHIVMTSRGCAWACTFCGAETTWGRGFRGHSVEYVVDSIEHALARVPVRMLQIKDDTFTTVKKRVLAICREIRRRDLRFLWSCDTRVDLLDEELLTEMRLAGCQRLSLGVESGSQRVLDAIDKKITVAEILESTRLAKSVGLRVRYYMMLGNRGDTAETFRESLAFLDAARPHEAIFSCLSIYPGTRDFDDAVKAGWLDPAAFFEGDFQELKTPFDASDADAAVMNAWFRDHAGLRVLHRDTVEDRRAILARLGDHHAAHLDLAESLFHAGAVDEAEAHVRRALELETPVPGLAWNDLAVIAKARGDVDAMMQAFSTAAKLDPQHWVLIQNVTAARAWFKAGGPSRGLPLELAMRHDFQLLERTTQPTLPGPLADDFATWGAAPSPPPVAPGWVKTPEHEGSRAVLGPRGRLTVLPG